MPLDPLSIAGIGLGAGGLASSFLGGGNDGGAKQAYFPSRTTNKSLKDLLKLVGDSKGLKNLGLDPEQTRGNALVDTDSEFSNLFGEAGLEKTRNQLFGFDGGNNGILALLKQLGYPAQDLINQDLASRGGSLSQFREADPALSGLFGQLGEELDAGGALDPGSLREVQQATRAAQQARGMGFGNSDVFEEAMNVGNAAEERRRRTQSFGLGLLANPADFASNQANATPASAFQTSLGLFGTGQQLGATAGPSIIKDPFGPNGIVQTPSSNPGAAVGSGLMGLGGTLLGAGLSNANTGGGGSNYLDTYKVGTGAPKGTYNFGWGQNTYLG